MKIIALSVVLMTFLAGCGVEWFPNDSTTTSTPVSITTSKLADAPTGFAYSQKLTSSGGAGTKTWIVATGNLPEGLSLSADGTISGTPIPLTTSAPTTNLDYTITVKVSDSTTTPATATLTIFTPTTGRMYDSTGKVYAETLTFTTSSGVVNLTVTNPDTVGHIVQVEVANYDAAGIEVPSSAFTKSTVTAVVLGTPVTITNTPTSTTVNNWRIKSVKIIP